MMGDAGQVPEIAALGRALEGEAPAGADLRQDFSPQSFYFRLRDARAEAREMERRVDQGDPDGTLPVTIGQRWRTVRELAIASLSEKTKDLEIASWLTEALVRSAGIGGLTAGATVLSDLVEHLWDAGLHPLPDEDGIETRVAPITGLNGQGADGTLMQPLRKVALFTKPDGEEVTFWQYRQSEELEGITDATRRKQRLAAGVVLMEDLQKAARAAGQQHFAQFRSDVKAALSAWTTMGERLDARAGGDSPPTARVRDVLQAVLEIANAYAPPEAEAASADEADRAPDALVNEAGSGLPGNAATRSVTRDDMLRELGRIAEYFRRTEPHSPLAYTLEEAVRRGRLTWPELLEEVVPDAGSRSAILMMLGIRPGPPPE
jgi:type VI secretion system protein ImpA